MHANRYVGFNPPVPLPFHATNAAWFLDRTNFSVATPVGPWPVQRLVFNGHAWDHVLGAQGCVAPDGMFIHFYTGVISGRHNDQHFFDTSGIDNVAGQAMAPFAQEWGRTFWGYTDKGYTNDVNHRRAYHGLNVTPLQHLANYLMSFQRVIVEWGFGKLKNGSRLLQSEDLLKLQATRVTLWVKAATLICNSHTCLYGSDMGLYYGLAAEPLETYFA